MDKIYILLNGNKNVLGVYDTFEKMLEVAKTVPGPRYWQERLVNGVLGQFSLMTITTPEPKVETPTGPLQVNAEQLALLMKLREAYLEYNEEHEISGQVAYTLKYKLTWNDGIKYDVTEIENAEDMEERVRGLLITRVAVLNKRLEEFCESCDKLADELSYPRGEFFEDFIVGRGKTILLKMGV